MASAPAMDPDTIHNIIYRESDIAGVVTTLNVFSYDEVWSENRTHNIPNT